MVVTRSRLKKRTEQSFAMRQGVTAVDEPQIRQNGNLDGPPTKKTEKKKKNCSKLCSLPDDILHIILGLLRVQEAVGTCVLSKRWEHLWMSMPVLNFNHDLFSGFGFENFVDKVCVFHEPFPIQTFRLNWPVFIFGAKINAWITAAVMRGQVQVLRLYRYDFSKRLLPPHKVVPLCIFRSETLVELTLHIKDSTFELPEQSIFYLPRLKILALLWVELLNGERFENLVSSCPLLEKLDLVSCYFEQGNSRRRRMSLSSPCLRELNMFYGEYVSKTLPSILIHCASLEKFCYNGKLDNEICICGPTTRLVAVQLWLVGSPAQASVFKLLNAVAHVKELVLYGESIEGFSYAVFPEFSNLVDLTLSVFYCYDRMTMPILRRCPRLESLTLLGAADIEPSHELLKLNNPIVPDYFKTHIKKIRLTRFWASDEDIIECVGMLLRICDVLETLVIEIWTCRWPYLPDTQQLLDKVSILPKNSTKSCRIVVFLYDPTKEPKQQNRVCRIIP